MELPGSGLHLRPALLAAGYRDAELRILRRSGTAVTVRPGAYVASDDTRLSGAYGRHLLAVRAAVASLGPGAVVSHASAAVVHGLPLWGVSLSRVHVTRDRRSGGRLGRLVHVHAARMDEDEVVEADGMVVTSVVRTVVDLCRSIGFAPGVVTADAALRVASTSRAELVQGVERSAHRRGNGAAARVIAFADGRSESVGESRSRVALARSGLPAPVPQFEVHPLAGRLVGRADFGWPELGTVGEFDGLAKYGRLRRPGEAEGDAVVREKLREDAIRDTGLRCVRWVWAELDDFAPVSARLTRAFAAS